jgi:hypothetical protein
MAYDDAVAGMMAHQGVKYVDYDERMPRLVVGVYKTHLNVIERFPAFVFDPKVNREIPVVITHISPMH